MALRVAATCLVTLSLPQRVWSVKDPWDSPDGGEEVESASPMGGMSPEDEAQVVANFQRRAVQRRAHSQHAVMQQFMKKFARNMRVSVLEDSKGDMPEEQRQRLIAQAEAQQQAEAQKQAEDGDGGDGPGFAPPQEAEEMAPPPPPRRQPKRMLNMAEA